LVGPVFLGEVRVAYGRLKEEFNKTSGTWFPLVSRTEVRDLALVVFFVFFFKKR
jgi:hypothetical protein